MSHPNSTAKAPSQLLPEPPSWSPARFWHCVQFYESDESLANSVCHFINKGLKAGEGVVVIATASHHEAFEKQLRETGVDVDQASERGQYVPFDAKETLPKLMVDGKLDPGRFNEVIGGSIEKVRGRGYRSVRAFGEMVALLWEAGQQESAIRLEELWSDAAKAQGFAVLCAYPIGAFNKPAHREPFLKVCSAHSHVLPAETYGALGSEDERLRAIAQLQQRATWLEEALRESEARFLNMADTAPVMIWVSGPDKECTFLNKEWLDFTGRSLEQELGNGWAASVHRDDLDHCLEVYVSSFDSRQMFTMEYRLRRSDGEYRWVLDNGVPRFAPDNTFLGYIGSCTDVTGLKRAQEAVRESQKRYRIATEAGRVGIWDLNLETREIYIDPGLTAVLGFKPDEIRNHFDDWSQRVHPEDIDSAMALMQAHIRGEASSYEFEHRMLHKDGSTRWFLARGRLPRHEDGTVRHLLGTYTDITERKEAEVEVERQRNELAHLSRVTMLGTLSGSLAHELNQPLTAILSNAQAALRLLAREGANLNEVRDTLNDIVEDNRRASDIIRRLRLLLKKGDSHHLPLAINELVQDTLKLVHRDLVSNRVTVHTQLALELPAITGDPVQLQQVLLNLMMNACGAMVRSPAAERKLLVRTALIQDQSVRVSIKDQGCGIPAQNLERIFDPFFTTHEQGMGLGLTISRAIIAAHRGKLWAENNGEGGASLHFVLPANGDTA